MVANYNGMLKGDFEMNRILQPFIEKKIHSRLDLCKHKIFNIIFKNVVLPKQDSYWPQWSFYSWNNSRDVSM